MRALVECKADLEARDGVRNGSGVHTMCSDTQKQFLNIQYNYNEYKTNDSSACPAALLASNAPTCMLCSATQRWPTNSTDRAARVRRTSPRRAGQ